MSGVLKVYFKCQDFQSTRVVFINCQEHFQPSRGVLLFSNGRSFLKCCEYFSTGDKKVSFSKWGVIFSVEKSDFQTGIDVATKKSLEVSDGPLYLMG